MFEKLIGVFGGFVAPYVIGFLKDKFGLEDELALLLAGAVSVVFALAALFASQRLGLSDFTLVNFAEVFPIVFAASELVFKAGKYRQKFAN